MIHALKDVDFFFFFLLTDSKCENCITDPQLLCAGVNSVVWGLLKKRKL